MWLQLWSGLQRTGENVAPVAVDAMRSREVPDVSFMRGSGSSIRHAAGDEKYVHFAGTHLCRPEALLKFSSESVESSSESAGSGGESAGSTSESVHNGSESSNPGSGASIVESPETKGAQAPQAPQAD